MYNRHAKRTFFPLDLPRFLEVGRLVMKPGAAAAVCGQAHIVKEDYI